MVIAVIKIANVQGTIFDGIIDEMHEKQKDYWMMKCFISLKTYKMLYGPNLCYGRTYFECDGTGKLVQWYLWVWG